MSNTCSMMMVATPSSSSQCGSGALAGGPWKAFAAALPSLHSARGVPAEPADDASRLHTG